LWWEGDRGKALEGYMGWKVYVAERDDGFIIRRGWLRRLGCEEKSVDVEMGEKGGEQ
jgi:hypothetical protein